MDKQQLKEAVGELNLVDTVFQADGVSYINTAVSVMEVYDLIDQLDEPEALSQELPVIPKFVADYLCRAKADVTLMRVLEIANTRNELPKWKKEYDWISANDETFARAWLDGYTAEEEQKYNVQLKVRSSFGVVGVFLYKQGDEVLAGDNFKVYHPEEDKFRLTEQEIKDYDERLWAFAVPVEVEEPK